VPLPALARRPRRSAVALLAGIIVAATAVVAVNGSHKVAGHSTFDATRGPHVMVSGLPGVDLTPLRDIPGLAASSGPFAGIDTSLRYRDKEVSVRLEGRPAPPSAVDRPLVVSGHWVRPHEVVLDRSTARLLRVPLGGRVTAATARGRVRLTVGGVADTTARSRNPGTGRGLGYVLSDTLAGAGPDSTFGSTMLLRLADPDRTGTYVDWIRRRYPGAQVTVAAPSRSR
jgi:hypothetical protein